jgi:HEAT repeat protein
MTNEDVLKTLLRGEPHLSADLIQTVQNSSSAIGPLLLELIKSIRLWHTEDAGRWAVLHAIRLISDLQVRNAIPALIDAIFLAYGTRHEDALEDLPVALARAGEPAIRPLQSVLEDSRLDGTIRSVAASALEGIAVLNPGQRDAVLEILRGVVSNAGNLSNIRSHVISILAHFRIPEDLPRIKSVAGTLPLMLELEPDEIDSYFEQKSEPSVWDSYRNPLTDYYL